MNDEKRYEYLINAWKFNYDNFIRWLTFYYVTAGAIFVAYYSDGISNIENGRLLINILGAVTSLLFYWSCKGFSYWEINWISLIHESEKNFAPGEKIYSCFANKAKNNNYFSITSGANISTPKISIALSFVIAVVWTFLLISKIFSDVFDMSTICCQFIYLIVSIVLLKVLGFIPKKFFASELNTLVDLNL